MLIEDFPGLGKTLAARTFAQALGLDFSRAQFAPDLLPADLTESVMTVFRLTNLDKVLRPRDDVEGAFDD